MKHWIGLALLAGACVDAYAAESAAKAEGCPAPAPAPAYYATNQIDVVGLLPPPPATGSAEQQADLQAVLAAQRAARADRSLLERALADSEMSCARFKDVLGPELKSPAAAKALKFISEAALSAHSTSTSPKRYWKRPRPFLASGEVERLGDVAVGGEMAWGEYPDKHCVEPPPKNDDEARKRQTRREKADLERNNTSYPSGHATFGMACALLLAAAVPEKRVELFARARQYGESRLILGAHYPSDVAAGQQAAQLGTALVMQNTSFERQFVPLEAELRQALGLPAALPDLEPNKDLFKEKDKEAEEGAGRNAVQPPPDGPKRIRPR
jgi:acid phosphatase (class A)